MNFDKSIMVDEFLSYKKSKVNLQFKVKLEIHQTANYWLPFQTEMIIENNISKEDYVFIFMDDIIGAKPYLGHIQTDMDYLDNLNFDGTYLFFTVYGKRVRLS